MEKLVDVFGTKYFAAHWSSHVAAYLHKHPEIDLAGARLTKAVVDQISIAIDKGAYIIDSENKYRDRLLAENRRRKMLTYKAKPLPRIQRYIDLPGYMENLDMSVTYTIDREEHIYIPIAVLLLIYYPEFNIDFNFSYEKLFKYVDLHLYPSNHVWDKFYILTGSTFDVLEFVNGKAYFPLVGERTYQDVMEDESIFLIPYEFGNIILSEKEEWYDFIDKVLLDIEEALRASQFKLKDFIS